MKTKELWPVFERARLLKRTLGLKAAAGYLRNKGVLAEGAVWILLRN